MRWRRFKKIERLAANSAFQEPRLNEEQQLIKKLVEDLDFCKCDYAANPQLNHKITIYKWYEDIGNALKDPHWINKIQTTDFTCSYKLDDNLTSYFCCNCIKEIKTILEAEHQAKIEKQYQKWKESRVKK